MYDIILVVETPTSINQISTQVSNRRVITEAQMPSAPVGKLQRTKAVCTCINVRTLSSHLNVIYTFFALTLLNLPLKASRPTLTFLSPQRLL